MAKNFTIAELVAAALVIVPTMTAEAAKDLINKNKAKSMVKIEALFTPIAAEIKTAAEAEAAKVAETPAVAVEKVKKPGRIRSTRTIEAGPRGFRFGGKWMESVAAGTGIAVHPTFFAKLKAHAASVNVEVAEGVTPVELAALIAAAPVAEVAETVAA